MNEDILKNVKIIIDEFAEILEQRNLANEKPWEYRPFLKEADLPYSIHVIKEAIKMYISFTLATNNITNEYLEKLKYCYVLLGDFAEEQITDKFKELNNLNLEELKNLMVEKTNKKLVDLFLEYLSHRGSKNNEYLIEINDYIDLMRLFLNQNK